MKIFLVSLFGIYFLLITSGFANAALTTIGTATYGGVDYNLIWDDNNNGSSIVWLDFTNSNANWDNQKSWAAGLDSAFTNITTPGYQITWSDNSWRLPDTVDGTYETGYSGNTTAGSNINSSEMGHLFYVELENLGSLDTNGSLQSGYGLINTGDFQHLIESWYFSGTEFADNLEAAWYFSMAFGNQDIVGKSVIGNALAVRSGQVSTVPVSGAIWLLGSGILGLAGYRRKIKK